MHSFCGKGHAIFIKKTQKEKEKKKGGLALYKTWLGRPAGNQREGSDALGTAKAVQTKRSRKKGQNIIRGRQKKQKANEAFV